MRYFSGHYSQKQNEKTAENASAREPSNHIRSGFG